MTPIKRMKGIRLESSGCTPASLGGGLSLCWRILVEISVPDSSHFLPAGFPPGIGAKTFHPKATRGHPETEPERTLVVVQVMAQQKEKHAHKLKYTACGSPGNGNSPWPVPYNGRDYPAFLVDTTVTYVTKAVPVGSGSLTSWNYVCPCFQDQLEKVKSSYACKDHGWKGLQIPLHYRTMKPH